MCVIECPHDNNSLSCAARASNLFGAVTNGSPVSSATCMQAGTAQHIRLGSQYGSLSACDHLSFHAQPA
jgi:hypothetical protein